MNDTVIELNEWLNALSESAVELLTETLGFESGSFSDGSDELAEGLCGAYISLLGEDSALELGIVSDAEGCEAMAQALLGLEPGDGEDLSEADVADAVNEVVDIVAGGVKTRMVERDPTLKMGLPVFVEGRIKNSASQESAITELVTGGVKVHLMVLRQGTGT